MQPDDIRDRMPDTWFEDQGVKLDDTPVALFLDEGRPMLGLFLRNTHLLTVPMAVSQSTNIYLVVECLLNGFFKRKVRLVLKDRDGGILVLNIPLAALAKGCEENAADFFALVHKMSSILSTRYVPPFMFARNVQLKSSYNAS